MSGLPTPRPVGTARGWQRLPVHDALLGLIPLVGLLLAFGRLVADPSALLVRADRPTVDRARVVDAPPGNDLTRQFLPLHRWVGQQWRATGRLPTWDDRGFGGRPLVGNPQAGLFYPPVWIAWAVSAPATLGWITLGHLVWALVGMLRLGRTLALGQFGRTTAAGCFALNPYILAHVAEGHYPHVWAVCWYPWAADALVRVDRGERRSGLQLVLSLAAMALVGHPQEGYYGLIAGGLAILGRWVRRALRWGRSGASDAAGSIARPRAAVGQVVGLSALLLALIAVEIVPAQQVAAFARRSERPTSREAGQYHPTLLNALQLLSPDALGGPTDYFGPDNYWETLLGVGLVPAVLAGVGAVGAFGSGGGWGRRRIGWVGLVLGSVLFALGRSGGLFPLLFEVVPGMDRFRVPARSLFLAALGVAILAGQGVEALATPVGPPTVRPPRAGWPVWLGRWLVALALLAIAVGWGTARTRGRNLSPQDQAPTVASAVERDRRGGGAATDQVALALARLATDPIFGLAVAGLTLGLVVGAARPSCRVGVAVGWGLLALAELTGSGFRLLTIAPGSAFLEPGPIARAVAQGLPGAGAATGSDRQPRPVIRADAGTVSDLEALGLGLAKTDINDSFQIDRAAHLYEQLYELSRPRPSDRDHPATGLRADERRREQGAILARLGVVALVADRSTPRALALIDALGWPRALPIAGPAGRRAMLARAPDPLAWGYLVPRARLMPESVPSTSAEFVAVDPRAAVVMATDPLAASAGAEPRQEYRPADEVTRDGSDRVTVIVTTTGPGLLVLRQTELPGWSATVDGQPAPIGRGNLAQQVIPLPKAGRHEVRLRYDPPGLSLGAMITAVATGVGLLLWWHRRPRRAGAEAKGQASAGGPSDQSARPA